MDPLDRNFTRFMSGNSSHPTSQEHPSNPYMPNIPVNPYANPFTQSQLSQNSPPSNYMQHYGHLASQGRFQHYLPRFEGFGLQENMMPSVGMPGVVGNTSGSDPTTPSSRGPAVQQAVAVEESSGSSPDEEKRGGRNNWTDEENRRLASSWIHNSVDPIDGNAKKGDRYWKEVSAEFNDNMPVGGKVRTAKQCKSHWGKITKVTVLFHGAYTRARNTYSSGQCDDMLMDTAREMYKTETQGKVFKLEYLWRVVKKEPKWRRVYLESDKNKRTKVSESGAYASSSNQDSEDANPIKERRPGGQKAAKEKRKGKEKGTQQSALGTEASANMILFHDAIAKRSAAMEKQAEVARENMKMKKMETYLGLMEKDTSNYNAAKLKRHEVMVEQLGKELFPEPEDEEEA